MLDHHEGLIDEEKIKIKMNPPRNLELNKKVGEYPDYESGGYVEIGVPHYVLFVKNVATYSIHSICWINNYTSLFQHLNSFVNIPKFRSYRM